MSGSSSPLRVIKFRWLPTSLARRPTLPHPSRLLKQRNLDQSERTLDCRIAFGATLSRRLTLASFVEVTVEACLADGRRR
jgi:hypothetical protein